MGFRTRRAAFSGKYANGLENPFILAGAPTSGTNGSYVRQAHKGSLLIDTANGKLYIATVADGSTVTWTVVGSQT